MKNKLYMTPRLLETVNVSLETGVLAGSIVNSLGVETAGQQNAGFYDLEDSATPFNVTWGD